MSELKNYRIVHNPTEFSLVYPYPMTIVVWAINGDTSIQDKIRARLYAAVGESSSRERARQIYSQYDEFLWGEIDIAPA